ncbi:Hpt domain-containing protein, partial [Aquabacterium sp. A08]|uniref:Hpt domain-containing protein n=1 Tax=Aquabacterium sp. A08 TaxID=2718532 RepID=UPI001AAE6345
HRLVHTLKGVAGNLGATAVQDAAQALDVRLREALEGRESQAVQTSAAAQEPAPVPDAALAEALAHLHARQDALVAGLRDWLARAGQPQPAPEAASADTEAQAPAQNTSPPEAPSTPGQFAPLLDWLDRGDTRAIDWAQAHASALQRALGAQYPAFRNAVAAFDFPTAAALLRLADNTPHTAP